ncbi:MAG: ArnT family glycosyltransferase, partial [Burkholderiales bacterium]
IVHRSEHPEFDIAQVKPTLHIPLWMVWACALGFVLPALGSYGILNNNEGLYAEIPREMLASHDWRHWVIPHLNGLPYMEKPPLLYWLTALSFSLFGISEWSARLAPVLSSLACVGMLVHFGQAIGRVQAGRLAALMFVSGVGVTVMSRTLMFDMLLTACLTAALMCAYRYSAGGGEGGKGLLRYAYAWLALAVMAKGIVAIILFGAVVALMLLPAVLLPGGFMRVCRDWFEPGAILFFLAIAAPWHIAASLVEPIFPWFYFINEHVLRFLGRREPHDYYAGAWWYYLPRMALYLFPWSFLLPCLLTPRLAPEGAQSAGRSDDARNCRRFLLLAWLAPLVFFSVSSAKANYYLVVVMPFAAFHLALALEDRGFLRAPLRLAPGLLIALPVAVCAAFAMRAGYIAAAPLTFIASLTPTQFMSAALAGLAGLALLCGIIAWRWASVGILAYLALPAWCAAALVVTVNAVEPLVSTRPLAQFLQTGLTGKSVYLYRNFEELSSLPFYLQQPVGVIDSRSNDLYWGNKLQANDLLITGDQFEKILSSRQVAVVVPERQIKDFRASRFFMRIKGERHIGAATVFFN